MKQNSETNYGFPIEFMEFEKIDYEEFPCYDEKVYGRGKNENAIAIHYEKKGWEIRHYENEIVWNLFGYICYQELLRVPDWNKWDPQKSINAYPELCLHLSKQDREWVENFDINLGWSFSDECLLVNGQPALLGVGIPYQMCKTEIDHFIYVELPRINIEDLINENYELLEQAREKYRSLFNWASYYHPITLSSIVQRIPLNVLQFILHKMFLNFHYYRTGFPDFWIWHPDHNNIKLIEVKGKNEKIGIDQIWWLEKLYELGVDASVIRIKWKKLK